MSRYIDADYVNAFPIRIDHYDEEHGNRHFVLGIESVMEYIDEAPSIDIVRCAECAFKDTDRCPMDEVYLGGINADDFCSYGEREGE